MLIHPWMVDKFFLFFYHILENRTVIFKRKNRLILWVIGKERLMINLYASSYDKECDRRWVIDTAQI